MKLAANISFLYRERPEPERIAAAAADGFDGVECLFPYALDPALLARRLREAGLPLVLINTPLGPAGEPGFAAVPGAQGRFLDGLRRALDLAQRLACSRVHVMAGLPGAAALASGQALQVLEDNLRQAAPLARQAGVVLLLEALNRHDMPGYAYHRPAEVVSVLQRLDTPDVRLQFDLFHTAREGLDLGAELLAHRDWVHHVQIAAAPGRTQPDLARPEMARALRTLRDLDHGGWLGFEYQPTDTTAASLGWREPLRALLAETRGVCA